MPSITNGGLVVFRLASFGDKKGPATPVLEIVAGLKLSLLALSLEGS